MSESGESDKGDDDDVIVLTSEAPSASDERRALLRTENGPDRLTDLLVMLEATCCEGRVKIVLQYVPDRRVLPPNALKPYLATLSASASSNLERLVLTILDDIKGTSKNAIFAHRRFRIGLTIC